MDESLDKYAVDIKDLGIPVDRIKSIGNQRYLFQNFVMSWRYFLKSKPRCVHFHCPSYRWGLEVVLAAKIAGVPTIIRTEHNPILGQPSRLINLVLNAADKATSIFTYVSAGNKDRYEACLPRRIGRGTTICNGVNPNNFVSSNNPVRKERLNESFGFPSDSRIAVHLGVFGNRRPLPPIFESYRALLNGQETRNAAERWRILVIGTGNKAHIEAATEIGVASYVHCTGGRKDVAEILPLCDLFISASHYEGQSISMLEAWACGLPLLTTDVDGISDVIGKERANEQSIQHGDSDAYARAWFNFMIGDTTRRDITQEACRIVREKFTTKNMTANYLDLYREHSLIDS